MSFLPNTSEVLKACRDIVLAAFKEGTHDSLTKRKVRQKAEELLEIEAGVLETKDYKSTVNATIDAAVEEGLKDAEEAKDKKPAKKRKSSVGNDSGPSKKKKKSPETEQTPGAESGSSAPVSAKGKKKIRDSKTPKSAATVESSDEGGDPKAGPSSTEAPSKPKPSTSEGTAEIAKADNGNKSDSELSVLIDEPPKHGRKAQSKEKGKKPTKEKKTRKPAAELSKDEETIKRLKSFVFACGVRKVWNKELQGLDKPSQQIRKIKEILSGLGMTGRMSLERAKSIREKREFAQELEDVQNFEKEVASRTSRRTVKDEKTKPLDKSDEDSEGGEEEDLAPVKKKNAARMSIMAFLGDESDD